MTAIDDLHKAYCSLKTEGWRDALYAPKDGTQIEIVCAGSIGIFKASWVSFDHGPINNCGSFFAEDGGDLWPSDPILWRPIESALARGVRLARGGNAPTPKRSFS